jgi:WD40 repeat protein
MKLERPRFELARVYTDGAQDEPEIVPVGQMPWDTKMERRGFLGVGVGVASLLLLVDGQAAGDQFAGNQDDVPARFPKKVLKAHRGAVTAIAISPDGKTLASASEEKTIKVWALPKGNRIATIPSRQESVTDLAMSPDGTLLASVAADENVKLWSLPTGRLRATLKDTEYVRALAISPDGKMLATTGGDSIKLWTLPAGAPLGVLGENATQINALAISPDSKILVSGAGNETIQLWSLPEKTALKTFPSQRYGDTTSALAVSPDGQTLLSISAGRAVKLWSLPEGRLLKTANISSSTSLAISPQLDTMALAISYEGDISLRSVPEGNLLGALEGHQEAVNALSISPDGEVLASGDNDGVIALWDLKKRSFISFLFDPKANAAATKAISYNRYDRVTGRTITYTLPCGSPVPPGAVCTCNCVPGTYVAPRPKPRRRSGGGGLYCSCNKICTCIPVPSDRAVKEAFETTDPLTILQRLTELPIETWNYKWDAAAVRHIGPMAQDFAAAFAVGEDDKHICTVDAQGVAFAAIQGLYRLLQEKDAQTAGLQAQLQRQQTENQQLTARVENLERLLQKLAAK